MHLRVSHRLLMFLAVPAVVCLLFITSPSLHAQPMGPIRSVTTFANPLDLPGADPTILLDNRVYHLYLATPGQPGIKVWTSMDLVHWQLRGTAYKPARNSWVKKLLWAPCIIKHNNQYLLYFNAVNNDAQGHRICVATSDSPLGPFSLKAAPLWDPGYATIDAEVFIDDDGKGYLFYSKDISQNEVSEIWVAPLSKDLMKVVGPPTRCIGPDHEWEFKWNEAPCVIKKFGTYFLLYSGNVYTSPDYAIGYATSDSPLGPWTKPLGRPIMSKTPQVSGPGHCCIAPSPDGREFFIVYHTHQQPAGGGERQIAIDRLRVIHEPHTQPYLEIDGPSTLSQNIPSGAPARPAAQSDSFYSRELNRNRWTIVNEDPSQWKLDHGDLVINTKDSDSWGTRFDLSNLFLQAAPTGDFRIIAHVDFRVRYDYELAYIIIWQDHNNFIRLGNVHAGRRAWHITRELDGKPEYLSQPNTMSDTIWMRITKRGRSYSFSVSLDGVDWWPVGQPLFADFSEIQVGLGAISPGNRNHRPVHFKEFRIEPINRINPTEQFQLGSPSHPAGLSR